MTDAIQYSSKSTESRSEDEVGKHLSPATVVRAQSPLRPMPASAVRNLCNPPTSSRLNIGQTALAIGAFATTLTTLSLSLMEWRGVTIANIHVANFFFVAAFGLLVTAQWELAAGNGFAYTVFSAFGKALKP